MIWLLYPETKGCALEDMDLLFQKYSGDIAGVGLHGLPADHDEEGRELNGGADSRDTAGEDQPLLTH